jgi:diguanylate cyclase (GGDEF)-like protein
MAVDNNKNGGMSSKALASTVMQPAGRSLWARCGDFVVGVDARQRLRVTRSLLSALVYVVCIALIGYESYAGIMDARHGKLLAGCCLLVVVGFYLALRSGWSLRWRDPALTLQQILVAQSCIAGAYAISGAAHAGTLMLLALVLVFGIFSLSVRLARLVSLYTVALIGAVMLYKSIDDPILYPPRVEAVYFVFTATILPTIALLAGQLTQMRDRLKTQKKALEFALAHIESMATRDELTGLFNRRYMLEAIGAQVRRQARSGQRFSLVLVDLDHFKHFNDDFGHAVGDQVLRIFALQTLAALRDTDIIGRWGGEEFLLLLPETPPGSSTHGVARLREQLANLPVSDAVPQLRIQFSAGVIEFRAGEPIEQAIERADRALYAAKSAGRNCTIVL